MKRFLLSGIGLICSMASFAQNNINFSNCLEGTPYEKVAIIMIVVIYVLIFTILANAFVSINLSISKKKEGENFKSWKHQVMLFASGLFIGMSIVCLLVLHILL